MAIYYYDPLSNSNTDRDGTFAAPYAMFAGSGFPILVKGDECRIIGKPLTTWLTATEYTVTIRDSAVNTSGSALSALTGGSYTNFQQYDIVWFPDYNVFMRLSAGTFNSSGIYTASQYKDIPICEAGKVTNVRMRLVDRTLLPTHTSSAARITLQNPNTISGITITDGWSSDGVRVTDGSVKSIITHGGTATSTLTPITPNAAPLPTFPSSVVPSTADYSNTHCISAKAVSAHFRVFAFDYVNTTQTYGQIYATSTSESQITGAGTYTTRYGRNNNITVKNMNFYSNWMTALESDTTITLEKVVGLSPTPGTDGISRFVSNVTINYGDICCNTGYSTACVFNGSQAVTVNFNGFLRSYSAMTTLSYLSSIASGNITVNFGPSFSSSYKWNGTPITQNTVECGIYANNIATAAQQYYKNVAPPTGWTVATPFIYQATTNTQNYYLQGKRVPTRKLLLDGFATRPTEADYTVSYVNVNIACVAVNGEFEPIDYLVPINAGNVGSTNLTAVFNLTQDSTKYPLLTSPAMKFTFPAYNSVYWTPASTTFLGGKVRSIKNVAVPCVAGTPMTLIGKFETDDTSYLVGDFEITVIDASGDDIVTPINPSLASINTTESWSFTFTPSYTGEVFLTYLMTGYRGNQTYWVSEVGVS